MVFIGSAPVHPNSFNFMQFLEKLGKLCVGVPEGFAPTELKNILIDNLYKTI